MLFTVALVFEVLFNIRSLCGGEGIGGYQNNCSLRLGGKGGTVEL